MKSKPIAILGALIGIITLATFGCGEGGTSNSSAPVSVQKQEGYYNVTLDYTNTSHREMGRQFALAINSTMPDYAATIDSAIATQMYFLENAPVPVTFSEVVQRAQALFNNPNFYLDYKDEIEGMQAVFNYEIDLPGDGRLSKNELLVFQLFPDVMRWTSCSASAAYANASVTGTTIIGRNLDWVTALNVSAGKLHAVTTFKNGARTIANIGILGQLGGISAFNTNKVFGAILDAETGRPYPSLTDLTTRRSYIFDLRYALENYTTLSNVAAFMASTEHVYAYNHLIFVADPISAGVVENQVNSVSPPNRSLRIDSSTLNPYLPADQRWAILNAFATVNDFRLVGNAFSNMHYNTARWTSFTSKYQFVFYGQKIDIPTMKTIAGYPGPSSTGKMDDGAIFVSETQSPNPSLPITLFSVPGYQSNPPAYTTIQSILMDMGSGELWAHFVPSRATPPLTPSYQQIKNPIY